MNYFSNFQIGQEVVFNPAYKDILEKGLAEDIILDGFITAIRFTKEKVFYDAVSTYYGIVYRDIPSDKVFEKDYFNLKEAED
jgi:hypothetical protein